MTQGRWRIVRPLLKAAAIVLAVFAVSGLVLYAAGLRVVLDGGGTPRLRFVESEETREARLASHREAQRAAANDLVEPTPASPVPAAAATPEPATVANSADAPPTLKAAPVDPSPFWTSFRGPRRDGHYDERPIRTRWPAEGLTPIWKQPVGGGYASFVAARGRAFTIEQRGAREVVAAYDIATGRELWTDSWEAAFREYMGGDGPRATPTWDDGVVYALGGEGELRALREESGRVLWRTNILADAGAGNLQWGMAASPLVVDDAVIVLPGGRNGQSLAAYDRRTGKRMWSALDDQAAYSSPMLVTLGGVRQILIFSASRLAGVSPDNGRILWEHPWKTQFDIHASQPLVIDSNRVFLSSGYGTGAAVLELTPSESGLAVREVWRNIRMKNQFSSSVLHEGFIYGLDESILACVDAATGELKWKGGRYGYGQVMLASGHVIVLTEDGRLALVRATPERHEEVASFAAIEGKTWNHPAMVDGMLLVRNANEMAAFDLRQE